MLWLVGVGGISEAHPPGWLRFRSRCEIPPGPPLEKGGGEHLSARDCSAGIPRSIPPYYRRSPLPGAPQSPTSGADA